MIYNVIMWLLTAVIVVHSDPESPLHYTGVTVAAAFFSFRFASYIRTRYNRED